MTVGGQTMQFEEGSVSRELKRARRWLAMNRTSGARFMDFSELRD
jgi:hypothetical protein